jgi:phosphate transport system permease protein
LRRRRLRGQIGWTLSGLSVLLVAFPLIDLLAVIVEKGLRALSPTLFTQVTNGISGGLWNAIQGTLLLVVGALVFAVPIGVLSGIYVAEWPRSRFAGLVRFVADVMTGIPSVVLGYFGYITMVIGLGWQFSLLAGAITLALMVIPYIARTTELAMLNIGHDIREAGSALGLSQGTVIFRVVLPGALSGVLSGIMLAVAISVGETAPLIYTAGWSNYAWNGSLVHAPVGYLTYVIWTFINQPFASAHALAFAAALLVIALVLLVNAITRTLLQRR